MSSAPITGSLWLDRPERPAGDPFEPDARYGAVVVGAGLTGLTTALLLSRAGVSVAVLEARHIGAVTTGNTTAKLSLLQGAVLSGIKHHFSAKTLRAYVEGNLEGQSWLLRYLEEQGVEVQRRDAYTYAVSDDGRAALERELAACREAELEAELLDQAPGLPFPTTGSLHLPDQAQFDPLDVLEALAGDLRGRGVPIIEGVRVLDVEKGDPATVVTQAGSVHADQVVLATGTPILDRGLYFAKLEPGRSYAAAYRFPAPATLPAGMYLSIDQPGRSLRTAPHEGHELLVVGGNGHPVGREESPARLVADLDEWTQRHFPGAERTHSWSAQDYRSANMVPFVGALPRGGGKIHVGTGYNKWGMTNAVAASLSIASDILGGSIPWAKTLHHRITGPADIVDGVKFNAGVAGHLASGWAKAELGIGGHSQQEGDAGPAEGGGIVHREGGKPVAVSRVDGTVCKVSAVCTHLGGILAWNDAERSWDCPLHGSRFSATGERLEGPAVNDLERIADQHP